MQARFAVADPEAASDVAEDMDPAGLTWDVRVDEGECGVQAAVPIGSNQPQGGSGEPATGEIDQEGFPMTVAFLADEAVVNTRRPSAVMP